MKIKNFIWLACIGFLCVAKSGCVKSEIFPDEQNTLFQLYHPLDSFDPIHNDKAIQTTFLSLIHGSLWLYDAAKKELRPDLLKKEEPSKDHKIWTLLLHDVQTPKGQKLACQDVLFSVALYKTASFRSSAKKTLDIIKNIRCDKQQTKVVIETKEKAPYLPWVMTSVRILPMPIYLEALPKRYLKTLPKQNSSLSDFLRWIEQDKAKGEVKKAANFWANKLDNNTKKEFLQGFGPFFVVRKDTRTISLKRNPNRSLGEGNVEQICLTIKEQNPSMAILDFQRDRRNPSRVFDPVSLRGVDKEKFTIREMEPDGSTLFWWLNQSDKAPISKGKLKLFQSFEFRRALLSQMKREETINQAFEKKGIPLYGPVPESSPFYAKKVEDEDKKHFSEASKFDEKMKELGLRKEKGFYHYREQDTWKPLTILIHTTPSPGEMREKAANTVANSLLAAGIKAKVQVIAFSDAVGRIMENFRYEAMLMFLEGSPHPISSEGMYSSKGRMHFFHRDSNAYPWENEVDTEFELFKKDFDKDRQKKAFGKVQEIWVKNLPVFYLATQRKTLVLRHDIQLAGKRYVLIHKGKELWKQKKLSMGLLERPLIENIVFTLKK